MATQVTTNLDKAVRYGIQVGVLEIVIVVYNQQASQLVVFVRA